MADRFITELDAVTTFTDDDLVVIENDPSGTPETVYMTIANWVTNYLTRVNYTISRTVATNNVTVAIKDADGNDATTAKPLTLNIAGTLRKLSSALSVTVNAGTNTFNLGATEFTNLAQELFVYAGWRASDTSVFVLIHRLPHLRNYADVSAVATNENYGAYSGAAPAAADALQLIGRVNVQNSGSASYNWSIPAANTVINSPVHETTWLTWTPTITGFSSNPTLVCSYQVGRNNIRWVVNTSAAGTSNLATSTITLPFTSANVTNLFFWSKGRGQDNGTEVDCTFRVAANATVIDTYKGPGNTAWTNSGTKFFSGEGFYRIT